MRHALSSVLLLAAMLTGVGCAIHPECRQPAFMPPPEDMPRELSKVSLPTYTVEPPDILVIEAIHVVPRSPYLLRTSDLISINIIGTLPDAPVAGTYAIQPGGIVNLGPPYGAARISGMTIDQAAAEIHRVMALQVREPVVNISLVEMAGRQQIAGQHLVGPDGNVTLGIYGNVPVVGLTLAQAKQTIEHHLSQFLENPEVAVDVFAYNSKVYYVITEGAGMGDGVTRFPITGNETVLDAIANINGLTEVSSKKIWVARPMPHSDQMAILPVNWKAVTAHGEAVTNYQILPGDRIFVAEDRLVAFDTHLAKLLAPLNRGMGFILLSQGTAARLSGKVLSNTNAGFGGGGVF